MYGCSSIFAGIMNAIMTEKKDFENKLTEVCAEFGKMTPHQRVEKLYLMFDEK